MQDVEMASTSGCSSDVTDSEVQDVYDQTLADQRRAEIDYKHSVVIHRRREPSPPYAPSITEYESSDSEHEVTLAPHRSFFEDEPLKFAHKNLTKPHRHGPVDPVIGKRTKDYKRDPYCGAKCCNCRIIINPETIYKCHDCDTKNAYFCSACFKGGAMAGCHTRQHKVSAIDPRSIKIFEDQEGQPTFTLGYLKGIFRLLQWCKKPEDWQRKNVVFPGLSYERAHELFDLFWISPLGVLFRQSDPKYAVMQAIMGDDIEKFTPDFTPEDVLRLKAQANQNPSLIEDFLTTGQEVLENKKEDYELLKELLQHCRKGRKRRSKRKPLPRPDYGSSGSDSDEVLETYIEDVIDKVESDAFNGKTKKVYYEHNENLPEEEMADYGTTIDFRDSFWAERALRFAQEVNGPSIRSVTIPMKDQLNRLIYAPPCRYLPRQWLLPEKTDFTAHYVNRKVWCDDDGSDETSYSSDSDGISDNQSGGSGGGGSNQSNNGNKSDGDGESNDDADENANGANAGGDGSSDSEADSDSAESETQAAAPAPESSSSSGSDSSDSEKDDSSSNSTSSDDSNSNKKRRKSDTSEAASSRNAPRSKRRKTRSNSKSKSPPIAKSKSPPTAASPAGSSSSSSTASSSSPNHQSRSKTPPSVPGEKTAESSESESSVSDTHENDVALDFEEAAPNHNVPQTCNENGDEDEVMHTPEYEATRSPDDLATHSTTNQLTEESLHIEEEPLRASELTQTNGNTNPPDEPRLPVIDIDMTDDFTYPDDDIPTSSTAPIPEPEQKKPPLKFTINKKTLKLTTGKTTKAQPPAPKPVRYKKDGTPYKIRKKRQPPPPPPPPPPSSGQNMPKMGKSSVPLKNPDGTPKKKVRCMWTYQCFYRDGTLITTPGMIYPAGVPDSDDVTEMADQVGVTFEIPPPPPPENAPEALNAPPPTRNAAKKANIRINRCARGRAYSPPRAKTPEKDEKLTMAKFVELFYDFICDDSLPSKTRTTFVKKKVPDPLPEQTNPGPSSSTSQPSSSTSQPSSSTANPVSRQSRTRNTVPVTQPPPASAPRGRGAGRSRARIPTPEMLPGPSTRYPPASERRQRQAPPTETASISAASTSSASTSRRRRQRIPTPEMLPGPSTRYVAPASAQTHEHDPTPVMSPAPLAQNSTSGRRRQRIPTPDMQPGPSTRYVAPVSAQRHEHDPTPVMSPPAPLAQNSASGRRQRHVATPEMLPGPSSQHAHSATDNMDATWYDMPASSITPDMSLEGIRLSATPVASPASVPSNGRNNTPYSTAYPATPASVSSQGSVNVMDNFVSTSGWSDSAFAAVNEPATAVTRPSTQWQVAPQNNAGYQHPRNASTSRSRQRHQTNPQRYTASVTHSMSSPYMNPPSYEPPNYHHDNSWHSAAQHHNHAAPYYSDGSSGQYDAVTSVGNQFYQAAPAAMDYHDSMSYSGSPYNDNQFNGNQYYQSDPNGSLHQRQRQPLQQHFPQPTVQQQFPQQPLQNPAQVHAQSAYRAAPSYNAPPSPGTYFCPMPQSSMPSHAQFYPTAPPQPTPVQAPANDGYYHQEQRRGREDSEYSDAPVSPAGSMSSLYSDNGEAVDKTAQADTPLAEKNNEKLVHSNDGKDSEDEEKDNSDEDDAHEEEEDGNSDHSNDDGDDESRNGDGQNGKNGDHEYEEDGDGYYDEYQGDEDQGDADEAGYDDAEYGDDHEGHYDEEENSYEDDTGDEEATDDELLPFFEELPEEHPKDSEFDVRTSQVWPKIHTSVKKLLTLKKQFCYDSFDESDEDIQMDETQRVKKHPLKDLVSKMPFNTAVFPPISEIKKRKLSRILNRTHKIPYIDNVDDKYSDSLGSRRRCKSVSNGVRLEKVKVFPGVVHLDDRANSDCEEKCREQEPPVCELRRVPYNEMLAHFIQRPNDLKAFKFPRRYLKRRGFIATPVPSESTLRYRLVTTPGTENVTVKFLKTEKGLSVQVIDKIDEGQPIPKLPERSDFICPTPRDLKFTEGLSDLDKKKFMDEEYAQAFMKHHYGKRGNLKIEDYCNTPYYTVFDPQTETIELEEGEWVYREQKPTRRHKKTFNTMIDEVNQQIGLPKAGTYDKSCDEHLAFLDQFDRSYDSRTRVPLLQADFQVHDKMIKKREISLNMGAIVKLDRRIQKYHMNLKFVQEPTAEVDLRMVKSLLPRPYDKAEMNFYHLYDPPIEKIYLKHKAADHEELQEEYSAINYHIFRDDFEIENQNEAELILFEHCKRINPAEEGEFMDTCRVHTYNRVVANRHAQNVLAKTHKMMPIFLASEDGEYPTGTYPQIEALLKGTLIENDQTAMDMVLQMQSTMAFENMRGYVKQLQQVLSLKQKQAEVQKKKEKKVQSKRRREF